MHTPEHTLWHAAWNGDIPALQQGLASGTPVNQRLIHDSSPLEAAAYNAQSEACDLLLRSGADPNATSLPTGETVLHQAITKSGDPRLTRIVRSLIAAGADVNRKTNPRVPTQSFARDIRTRGETPLHRAAAYGDLGMILALIEAGAEIPAKDINGDSPLTWASWHLRENEILRALLHGEFLNSIP